MQYRSGDTIKANQQKTKYVQMQDHMQSDHLCHRSPQKEEWWVSVHSYFSVRKGFPSSDLKRHLWVSHNLICESWHQHLQIGTIHHLYHSSSFFSATQL